MGRGKQGVGEGLHADVNDSERLAFARDLNVGFKII